MSKAVSFIKHKVAHHFDTTDQEFDSAKIGMWLFLAQELLFFSGLFVAYAVFRFLHPEMFIGASKLLSWKMGAVNTLFLISSSFTMVMGVREAQLNNRDRSILYLILTFVFAAFFMVVKFFEYSGKIHHGFLPGQFFSGASEFEYLHLFFSLYFLITGLHGLHVVIGMGLILWLIYRSYKSEFYSEYYTPVEMVGLYWHLVDIVWILVFPLLYLIG